MKDVRKTYEKEQRSHPTHHLRNIPCVWERSQKGRSEWRWVVHGERSFILLLRPSLREAGKPSPAGLVAPKGEERHVSPFPVPPPRKDVLACSAIGNSSLPRRLEPARPLCPGDSPGKNTGVGCHALLQGIFPTQGSNPCLLPVSPALAGRLFTTNVTWEAPWERAGPQKAELSE